MRVYYAHAVSIYNTPTEERDISVLESLGFEVLNPNSKKFDQKYEAGGINAFRDFVLSCDLVAFRSLPDGRITSGAHQEVAWMIEAGKPVIELPSNFLARGMSVEESRLYLKECGAR